MNPSSSASFPILLIFAQKLSGTWTHPLLWFNMRLNKMCDHCAKPQDECLFRPFLTCLGSNSMADPVGQQFPRINNSLGGVNPSILVGTLSLPSILNQWVFLQSQGEPHSPLLKIWHSGIAWICISSDMFHQGTWKLEHGGLWKPLCLKDGLAGLVSSSRFQQREEQLSLA